MTKFASQDEREKFIAALPKAELHLHIEGALEPELMFALAERNAVEIPFVSVEEVRAAYAFSNLQDFLDIYYQGMSVLQREQDYYDLTMAYLTRVEWDNVRHVEIFFDPQAHTERGIGFATVADGILRALEDAQRDMGISSELIMCFLRHLDEDSARKTLVEALPYFPRISGVGLDSSELGHPPSKFCNVFAAAKEHGFKCVAHAGEEGPPEYVYEALDILKIDRLDHGNRALENDELVKRLKEEEMTLTVCPLSNLKLCVIDDMTASPLRTMLKSGLKATVNSDDPAYFGGYMNDNFNAAGEGLQLERDELITLAKNGFSGSFLEQDQINAHLEEIDKAVANHP